MPQHTRLPCPSRSRGVCSNLCTLSQWCCLTISSSDTPFSFCLQPFPASGSFPMCQFFVSGGQSIGASASVLPMNIQGWFPLGLTGLISLLSKRLSSLLQYHDSKVSVQCSAFFMGQLSHLYVTTEESIALTIRTFISKAISLLFNMLSRFVIAFLPWSKCLLISWLQSLSTVILEPKKIKSVIYIYIYTYIYTYICIYTHRDIYQLLLQKANFLPVLSWPFINQVFKLSLLYINKFPDTNSCF